MFKWKCRFELPKFDMAKYRRNLKDVLVDALAQGAFEWLNAALAEIPVWSGASQATFLHLSRDIGYPLMISPSGPDRTGMGRRQSVGNFDATKADSGIAFFNYETRLAHLIYNEYNNANVVPDPTLFHRLIKPGPYGFQQRATEAFERVVSGMELPDPRQFIKVKILRVR